MIRVQLVHVVQMATMVSKENAVNLVIWYER